MSAVPLARDWGGVDLLPRAIDYTRGVLPSVTPGRMGDPTPCAAWDLRALLGHMDDSMQALEEAVVVRRVWREPADPRADPVASLRARACRLLDVWNDDTGADVCVDGRPLTGAVLSSAGALEVAVHGWDVGWACGVDRPLPDELAATLLPLVPVLVTEADRPSRFGRPAPVRADAPPGERLLAALGRAQRRPRRDRR